jgi:hypothetical protein
MESNPHPRRKKPGTAPPESHPFVVDSAVLACIVVDWGPFFQKSALPPTAFLLVAFLWDVLPSTSTGVDGSMTAGSVSISG